MKYKSGTVAEMTVVRLADFGAFLDAGTGSTNDDILLHEHQQTAPVSVGDKVKVFLYHDKAGKLTASMRVPKMNIGQIARVKVINVDKNGAFLDAGAERGIFLPFAGMRGRPKVGEVVWAKLYTDKSGRLAMTMVVDDEMRRASRPADKDKLKRGDTISGAVYNITDKGVFVFTDERYIAFIDHSEIVKRPKVGEIISARVTYLREDGRINASMRPQKENAIDGDAALLLRHLKEHHGKIPYGDGTDPEIIKIKFNLSKAAFKRALGRLIKEGAVRQEDGWTYLTTQ